MSSNGDSVDVLIFVVGVGSALTAGLGVGLVYRWGYLKSEWLVAPVRRPSERLTAGVATLACLTAAAAVALPFARSAAAGVWSEVVIVTVMIVPALVLGLQVRKRHRKLGTIPPPPGFENPDKPPPGWEWDGARWRRT